MLSHNCMQQNMTGRWNRAGKVGKGWAGGRVLKQTAATQNRTGGATACLIAYRVSCMFSLLDFSCVCMYRQRDFVDMTSCLSHYWIDMIHAHLQYVNVLRAWVTKLFSILVARSASLETGCTIGIEIVNREVANVMAESLCVRLVIQYFAPPKQV